MPRDGHDHCLMYLGVMHAEAAFMDEWCPVDLPKEHAGPSQRCAPAVSFWMSIAPLEGKADFSGDDDLGALPPSGMAALPESDPEIMAMLS